MGDATSSTGGGVVGDEPWYRILVGAVASWTGASTLRATGLLSSGVLAAAIVVFYAWRTVGSRILRRDVRLSGIPQPPPTIG